MSNTKYSFHIINVDSFDKEKITNIAKNKGIPLTEYLLKLIWRERHEEVKKMQLKNDASEKASIKIGHESLQLKNDIKAIAKSKGLNPSSYLRNLILKDINKEENIHLQKFNAD